MNKLETLLNNSKGNYDTPKRNNLSAATIPADVVSQLEGGAFTSEMLQELAQRFPVLRYKTCVTVHGHWQAPSVSRIGGYKNIIANENGSLEIRYSALDCEKRERIAQELSDAGTEQRYQANSSGSQFYILRTITADNAAQVLAELRERAAKIDAAPFWGSVQIARYAAFGTLYLQLETQVLAVNEADARQVAAALAGMNADEFETARAAGQAAREERARQYDAENEAADAARAARLAAQAEAARPLREQVEKLPECKDIARGLLVRVANSTQGGPFFLLYRAGKNAGFGRVRVESAQHSGPTLPTAEEISALTWKETQLLTSAKNVPVQLTACRLLHSGTTKASKPSNAPSLFDDAPQPTPAPRTTAPAVEIKSTSAATWITFAQKPDAATLARLNASPAKYSGKRGAWYLPAGTPETTARQLAGA